MRPVFASALCLAALSTVFAACGDDGTTGESQHQTEEKCSATLRILQKDAYKDTAGRTDAMWPPHTTTALEVSCDGEVVATTFQANHGTEPGQVDANGDVILVEMATRTIDGSRAELLELVDAFDTCSCESATTFLSLDSLQDETAQALVETVSGYLLQNLTCPGPTTEEVVGQLQQGDVTGALAVLPTCTWASGASFEEGLDQAFAEIVEATGGILADYHVCNNDAVLQIALVDGFDATGEVTACNADVDTCKSPLWLYDPTAASAD